LVSGHKLRVILDVVSLRGTSNPDPDFDQTAAAVRVVDDAGSTLFERKFPYKVNGARFVETTAVHAEPVTGREGSGLLLTYSVLPSTPLGGAFWQVLGFVDGKLTPFSKPLAAYGDLAGQEPGQPARTTWDGGLEADVLTFRVWTGNFFVFVPLRIDWAKGKIGPGHRCWDTGGPGKPGRCRLDVSVERSPWEHLTLVRLFPAPDEKARSAVRTFIRKETRVEFLTAESTLLWVEGKEQTGFGVSDDIWLRVRIDGKEGWVHTQGDFGAIGLPHAG
jgi:hypothetical protein